MQFVLLIFAISSASKLLVIKVYQCINYPVLSNYPYTFLFLISLLNKLQFLYAVSS